MAAVDCCGLCVPIKRAKWRKPLCSCGPGWYFYTSANASSVEALYGHTVLHLTINLLSFLLPLSWQRHENLSILSEVSRQPKGAEWLWHPKVVALYKLVLQSNDSNSTGREAAVGALQNITAGESRVSPDARRFNILEFIFKVAIVTKLGGSLVQVGIGSELCGAGAGEDATHPTGSFRHQQRHRAKASDWPAEKPSQALLQQRPHG